MAVTPAQIAAFRVQHPDLMKKWREEERARVKAILKMAPPALKATAEKIALETDLTPGEAAVQLFEAYKAGGHAWDPRGGFAGAGDEEDAALLESAQRLSAPRGV